MLGERSFSPIGLQSLHPVYIICYYACTLIIIIMNNGIDGVFEINYKYKKPHLPDF